MSPEAPGGDTPEPSGSPTTAGAAGGPSRTLTDERPAAPGHRSGGVIDLTDRAGQPSADAAPSGPGAEHPPGSLEALLARQPTPTTTSKAKRSPVAMVGTVRERVAGVPLRQLVGGIVLCLVGIGLLAGWVLHVSWTPLMDLALLAIGLLLVLQAWRGASSRPLLVLGVVLAVMSVCTWRADASLDGGFGRRTIRLTQAHSGSYQLGTGQLTIDLRNVTPSGAPIGIKARVGVGRIVVRVAKFQPVTARVVAGSGTTSVFGKRHLGPGVDDVRHTANLAGKPPINLDLRVGIGSVEVRNG
ncbi:MAG: PspC protein [Acidimicrobiales bacterium]|nr:PspC protein [Acidimicrobiales bacterium]